MRNEPSLANDGADISEYEMNALCMRYGIAAAPAPNERIRFLYLQNALLTATSTVVRENLKCYEPNKRVSKRDVERAKAEVQKQYEMALKAIRDRRAELIAARTLLSEGGFVK
ncbi:hypothetical protein ANCCAN_05600 [Ancylostoma caninum]|uniref:Uncharacterized protein n=1 Tax=Ancylostoma caninum TaxID=29170 RepID=A0A368GVC4_ANCCA|nr:hypothetical protein ANCCAN_05600 [Ancylostoma caninum]